MSYIANRKFSNTPVGTEDQTDYMPGDPIHDFEDWPEHARAVLLRQGMVTPNFAAIGGISDSAVSDEGPPRRGPGRPRK